MRNGARMPRAFNACWTSALTPSASKDSDICSLLGFVMSRLPTRAPKGGTRSQSHRTTRMPSVAARLAEKLRAQAVGVRIARVSTYAAPRRLSDADALRWAARRLQEGTPEEQIVRELRQDGVPTQTAAAMVERVFVSYFELMRPRGRALERVLASAVLAALAGALLWIAWTHAIVTRAQLIVGAITPQMLVGAVVGVLVAVAVAYGAGGRRGGLVTTVA